MGGGQVVTITVLAAMIVIGIPVGAVVLFRAGIAREESDSSLLGEPRTLASAVTRRVIGLYVRAPKR
jgi:hypothetical protein